MLRKKMARSQINSEEWAYRLNDLGANIYDDGLVIVKLWSPSSFSCELLIFDKDNPNYKIAEINMNRSYEYDSIWEISLVPKNMGLKSLDSYFYQFKLDRNKIVLDPYAKSMAAFNPNSDDLVGKAAFINMKNPRAGIRPISQGINLINNQINKMIAYELHVRDFTISATSANLPTNANEVSANQRGTLKGFANWDWGINYLKKLGITHVQLLPIHNYYSVDENKQGFNAKNGDFYNYNWGYNPHSYFALEGWLSSNPNDPYSRIAELRELINKLHNNNIGVIIDVVYNHMFLNKILDDIETNVYFREKNNIYPVNQPAIASENIMTKKLIIDSISWLISEFGVDGFRFDLMGFINSDLIAEVREKYPNIILYGEAWNFTDLKPELAPIKGISSFQIHKIKDLGYFNDSIRKAVKGNTEDNEILDKGYISGNPDLAPLVRSSIIANLKRYRTNVKLETNNYDLFADNPSETIQYQAIHNGLTLWDKINLTTPLVGNDKSNQLKNKLNILKQALLITLTSQGRIVLQGGDEMGRTKPLTANDAQSTRAGYSQSAINLSDINPLENKYHENSYNASDSTNCFKWNRLKSNFENGAFLDLANYTSGLISFKKSSLALSMESLEQIQNNLIFLNHSDSNVIEFRLKSTNPRERFLEYLIIHNPYPDKQIKTSLKFDSNWAVIINQDYAGFKPISTYDLKPNKKLIVRPNESLVIGKINSKYIDK